MNPFHEKDTKSRKVMDLKKDVFYWYISFLLHLSIIEKSWNDAMFLQGLKHNKWVIIPSYALKGLIQNVKVDHKKKFHKNLQIIQLLPMFRCKYTSKEDIESRELYIFC